VALAMLVRRYDFRLDPAAPPVGMTTGATIHTSAGLHMFLTPRTHEQQPVSPLQWIPSSRRLTRGLGVPVSRLGV